MSETEFYTSQSDITDPKELSFLYKGLPSSIPELCSIVQEMLIHTGHLRRYGIEKCEKRDQNMRDIHDILSKIYTPSSQSLYMPRAPQERVPSICRDFSVLLCSFLRYVGIPSRSRCGFAKYFVPDFFEDHWICEYWDFDKNEWIQVDAQLDTIQKKELHIDFDSWHMPKNEFISAGEVWRRGKTGEIDASCVGFSLDNEKGLWYAKENMIRDFMALNKCEINYDDRNRILNESEEKHLDTLYAIAQWTTDTGKYFSEIQNCFKQKQDLFLIL